MAKLRFMIYAMAVLEFAFYSPHELIHHRFSFYENPSKDEPPIDQQTRMLKGFGQDPQPSESSKFKFRPQSFGMILSYIIAFAVVCLAIYETYLIFKFMANLFNAENVDEFKDLGNRSISADDVLHYFKYVNKGKMNPNKIKRMEKYLHQSLMAKKLEQVEKQKSKFKAQQGVNKPQTNLKYRKNQVQPKDFMKEKQEQELADQSSMMNMLKNTE